MKFTTAIVAAVLGTTAYGLAIPDPVCRFPGMPCSRSAEADPDWHSGFRRLPGQPISKREAEPEPQPEPVAEPEADPEADPVCRFPGMPCSRSAEPEPDWHSGFRRLPGQPISKREAEPDWHSGFRRLPGQPISKREAEPDWHSGFRRLPGQPISKREAEAEAEPVAEPEAEPEADPVCRFPGMPCS